MIQYALLLFVYVATIWLIVELGYDGLANIVEFRERKTKVNPLTKIFFEISIFIFLSREIRSLSQLQNVTFMMVVSLLLLVLGISFYILKDKLLDLLTYVSAYFLISFWTYSNTAYYPYKSLVLYTWPKIFSILFGYSNMITLNSYLYGLFEAFSNPVLYITLLGFVFISTTNTSELIRSFSELRIPLSITLIFAVFIKIIPETLKEMSLSYKMQIARGLGYNRIFIAKPFYYLYSLILVIFPGLVYVIKGSRNMAIALDTKGFRAYNKRSSLVRIGLNLLDYMLLFCSVFLIVISF